MNRTLPLLILLFLGFAAHSQTWSPLGTGAAYYTNCLCVYNGSLYAGGALSGAGGITTNHVAKWDGSVWSGLSSGTNGDEVFAMTVYNNELIVAGDFTKAGNVTGTKAIARWDGTTWKKMKNGLSGFPYIDAMAVYNGELYVAGSFNVNSTTPSQNIMKWNGTNWLAVTGGSNDIIHTLKVFNGKLVAGGRFTQIGGQNIKYVAQYNGSSWSALAGGELAAGGLSTEVLSLESYNNELYVSGEGVSLPGELTVTNLCKWNGTNWLHVSSAVAPGIYMPENNGFISSMAVLNNELYVGGGFNMAGLVSAINVAKWDGTSWYSLADGFNREAFALAAYNGSIYAGGQFSFSADKFVGSVSRWSTPYATPQIGTTTTTGCPGLQVNFSDLSGDNATTWSWTFTGGSPSTSTLQNPIVQYNVSGNFDVTLTTSGPNGVHAYTSTSIIAVYPKPNANAADASMISGSSVALNGSGGSQVQWVPSTGISNASIPNPIATPSSSTTYSFVVINSSGCADTDQVAVTVTSIPSGNSGYFESLSSGTNGTVSALLGFNDDLIAGGDFTESGGLVTNHIARWNGFTWTGLETGVQGTNASVNALANSRIIFGPDSYEDHLFVGGTFSLAGSELTSNLADWYSFEQSIPTWVSSISYDSAILTLLVPNGYNVYVGGKFIHSGSNTSNHVAQVGGALASGFNNDVNDLTFYANKLVAGGKFTASGATTFNHVATWSGTQWLALGGGMNDDVNALIVFNNDLYAGGKFTNADNTTVNGIARWDGTAWHAVGNGFSNTSGAAVVYSLEIYNGRLYAGGLFDHSGSAACNNLAVWDGTSWSAVSSGTNGTVYALASSQGGLFVGGNFSSAGGMNTSNIVKWYDAPSTLIADFTFPDTIYSGTSFQLTDESTGGSTKWDWSFPGATATDSSAQNPIITFDNPGNRNISLAVMDAVNHYAGISKAVTVLPSSTNVFSGLWEKMGSIGLDGANAFSFCTYHNKFYVGGVQILHASSNPATYNGVEFKTIQAGGIPWDSHDTVLSMIVYNDQLAIAGRFGAIGNLSVVHSIAFYNDSIYSSPGSGTNGTINALAIYNGELIAAGAFTTMDGITVNYIAKYNGSTWSGLGPGLNNTVYCLEVYNGELYAGGKFSNAGGVTANFIAKWNGTTWTSLGSGTNNAIYALRTWNGKLYAGGTFTTAGGQSSKSIASWNGSSWSGAGGGITIGNSGGTVYTIQDYHGYLYAGGIFDHAGGVLAHWLARFNGTAWSALPVEVDGYVRYLGLYDEGLAVTGNFIHLGTTLSYLIGIWYETDYSPHAAFKQNNSVTCANIPIAFTDVSLGEPNTWSWNFAGGTPASSSLQNPVVSYSVPGVYSVTLTITNSFGSSSCTKYEYLLINGPPYVKASASPDTLCTLTSANIAATDKESAPSTLYWWEPTSTLLEGDNCFTIAFPTATTTYIAHAMNACYSDVASDSVRIVAGLQPNPIITSSTQNICGGETITYTASGADSYVWDFWAATLYGDSVVLTAERNSCTTNMNSGGTLYAYGSGGCVANVPIYYTVYPNSNIVIQSLELGYVCSNGSSAIQLFTTSNDTLCRTFQWYKDDVAISGATGRTLNVSYPGSYYLVGTNTTYGCVSTSNIFFVQQLPTPVISSNTNGVICGNALLSCDSISEQFWKSWYRDGVLIDGPYGPESITITSPGSYQLAINYLGCIHYSNTIVFTTTFTASATAAGPTTFCIGNSVVLNATPTGSGYYYQWKLNNTDITGATNSSYTATTSGNYTVLITLGSCSSISNAIIITTTSPPSPTISAGGSTTFCSGGSVLLSSSLTGGSYTYQWKLNNSNISGATSATYSAVVSGNYSITVSQGTCSGTSNTINVTVNQTPNAVITAGGPTTFCSGGSVVLSATPTGTGYNYQWKKGNTNINGAINSTYTATAANTYKVIITKATCSGTSNTITVSVTSPPPAAITAGGPTTFCTGSSVVLSATPTGSGYSYQWKKGSANVSGAINATYTATASGSYKVIVAQGSCSGTSSATTVTVNALPAATITANGPTSFCLGDSVILTANSGAGYTYQWRKGSSTISGATNQSYHAKTSGSYKVQVTISTGCSKLSSGVQVSIICRNDGIDNSYNSTIVTAYPNPTASEISIEGKGFQPGRISIKMYNTLGEAIFLKEEEVNLSSDYFIIKVDLGKYASGIYMFKILSESGTYFIQAVKQ